MIKIIAVGDIMPGGLLSDNPNSIANNNVLKKLISADLRIGTLECALGNEPTYDPIKVKDRGNVIYAKEKDISRLKELKIDIVSLANNHFFDLGINGAFRTIEVLKENKIEYLGAGENIEEAEKPIIKYINNKSIAFLAFCDTEYTNVYYCNYADKKNPGVNPMTPHHVKNSIRKCKEKYDYVIVLPHWGSEHTFYPNSAIVKMSRLMVDSGADIILGSHPHRVQPIVRYKNSIIAFSMGNFLFPERLIAPPKVTYYPTEYLDLNKLPITDGYPIVDQITLKTLPYLARVGMLIDCKLYDSVNLETTYTYLNNQNTLEFLNKNQVSDIERKLKKIQYLLEMNIYKEYMFIKSFLIRCFNYLQKKILKNKLWQ